MNAAMNIVDMVLEVTQEDVDELLRLAYQARDSGQPSFLCQGWTIGVAGILDGPAHPIVQAIERLHEIRRQDHSQGFYRGDRLR